MEPIIRTGKRGFSLLELAIVMAIIAILVSISVPMYQGILLRTRETVLRDNLRTLRNLIDQYTADKKKAPQALQDLVEAGYLRAVPIDPITGSDRTWRIVMEDAITSVDQTQPGIYQVFSGSDLRSLEGTLYSEW